MSRPSCYRFPTFVLILLSAFAPLAGVSDAAKKIVLIAGPITGHPKETHEYEKNVILLKHVLETSPDLQGKVRVETHFKGWPADPSTLNDADTIFLTSDGTDRIETNHTFYVGDHFQVIERQMKRGCGLVMFHWSTFNPMRVHDQITEWAGGHFDYETGTTPNHWYSAIQTWEAESKLGTPDHPVTRGVKPFTTQEEYYYRIRFREADPRLKPIILTRPPKETGDFAVGWAVERADGGRGFGFTGGHFYKNWWNHDFRKLILNAIVWTAKMDIPPNGVRSEPFERYKALILTGHNHPAHDWRATTAALILALEQDPRAIVHVTENIEDLATQKIQDYDLLVLNYANWERPGLSEAARTNLVSYLEKGGGLSLIHFANGAWHPSLQGTKPEDAWPEYYTRICRRVWEHRPPNQSGHDSYGPFKVEIASVKHPIIDGLFSFDTVDELYFKQQGDLPIEPLAFALSKQTGQREPMAWKHDFGKGRIFQTVLGHSAESVRKAAALIRRGSVWAAGRNEISFDPPAGLTEGAQFREGSPWTEQESLKRAKAKPTASNPADREDWIASLKTIDTAFARQQPPFGALQTPPGADANSTRTTRAGQRAAGTPAISGREPGTQDEKDWIDNRWSRTDVGQFLCSSLKVPDGIITKALTIKVGDKDQGTVAYDMESGTLRAAWTGGFLKFDQARFGLLHAPKIDGEVQWVAPETSGRSNATTTYLGHHTQGKRVVLEYKIGEATLRESPWIESTAHGRVFLRDVEVEPRGNPVRLRVFNPGKGVQPAMQTKVISQSGPNGVLTSHETRRVIWTNDAVVRIVSITGPQGSKMILDGEQGLQLEFPGANAPAAFTIAFWRGAPGDVASFENREKDHAREINPRELLKPGPARWTPLETAGQVAPDSGPLPIDTLTVPYDNPWNALMFLSGVDFTSDGTAYVSSIHGDVWRVTGIDTGLKKLTWHRFATGLYQPLGLKVVKDQVYVLGRDRITRLKDENGDGEADFYENFCGKIATSPDSHHYVTSLETDASGNFYYVDPIGVHRVAPDGGSITTLATGFRNPNGMGASPDGKIVTVAPQQGEWTPSSEILEIKPGGYYGYGGPRVTPERPLGYDGVLCWIPHGIDNSSGSEVWVPENHWGALGGQMLHFTWGRCMMMLVLRDVVDGVAQGAIVPLPGRFLSGSMRGAFNRKDGNLYVVGSTGWQTSAIKDGSLQRVRRTDKALVVPVDWKALANGIELTFPEPLEKESAIDPGSFDIQQWNYRYAKQYGSKDWSVADPKKEGHDTLAVQSARLSQDGKSVFLEVPGIAPVMQMQIQYNLTSATSAAVRGKMYVTINRLGSAR